MEMPFSLENPIGDTSVSCRSFACSQLKSSPAHCAATDEKHDTAKWDAAAPGRRREGGGIEVGHIFYFGMRYTKALNAMVTGPDRKPVHHEMGSYG